MIGLCLADPNPNVVSDGSGRTLQAVHFSCRYRLCDFMLSNMSNSGIVNIAVVLNAQFQNLITHIGTGMEWDLSRKNGGITMFPPYFSDNRTTFGLQRDNALSRALVNISKHRPEYVVVTDCSYVYNIDYRKVLESHLSTGADITAIYTKKDVQNADCNYAVTLDLSKTGRVTGVSSPHSPAAGANVSLGAFLINKTILLQMLSDKPSCDMLTFTREIFAKVLKGYKVCSYEFNGYSAGIFSFETFFKHNMEMLDSEKRKSLFSNAGRRIYTSVKDSRPPQYGEKAKVSNCLIADGCQIDGTVENCILFRNVKIRPGAVIKNSILEVGVTVEPGASVSHICADTNVIITENRKLMGSETYPVYIPREKIV
jgi:glucose-1-phosphate adenylyltransferase